MLTQETKRHIDAARQVLVGVVPNPTSQIDQITNALIYKFMDDMDQSAIKRGDKPSFFVGDLEKYAWTRLMDSRIGNQERMNLYSEALSKFSESKKLPDLFRDVFKSAFLPYRSPEVLGLFLKEISYFDYKHSEELGNAYEYLLSIMSSQGDAGQFRTPRHIIDFIVAVVDPKKDDKILDPACGTAGFLISAYNHILSRHDGVDQKGKKNNEKELTPDDRKKLYNNFEGYDIDPGMERIAKVNMYLHKFKNPKIYQYDTLSMDDKWKDKFDVILANPPFMSPRGGVATHSKFSIESSRSEVLFVDYIMSHLKPNGRAGIIVPEGVIFQSGTAYKALRKALVEDGLFAVVSLPSGVFNPYAGVKTSILLFDNEAAKKKKEILFLKIENDGFDLGATKRPISKNDLPIALDILNKWKSDKKLENRLATYVEKSKIAENSDYNLSGDRYRVATDYTNAKWPIVGLEEVCELYRGVVYSKQDEVASNGYKVLRANNISLDGRLILDDIKLISKDLKLKENQKLKAHDIFICLASGSKDHIGKVAYINENTDFYFGGFMGAIRVKNEGIHAQYLFYLLKDQKFNDFLGREISGANINNLNSAILSRYKIPLPPLEIQEQIVAELDGYTAIIDGAKQIVKNWKPKIEIDPKWERVKITKPTELFTDGDWVESKDQSDKGIRLIQTGNIGEGFYFDKQKNSRFISEETFKRLNCTEILPGDVLISRLPDPVGRACIVPDLGTKMITAVDCTIVRFRSSDLLPEFFISYSLTSDYYDQISVFLTGSSRTRISRGNLSQIEIPFPPLETQKQIVEKIEAERVLVESAKKLIEIYDHKSQSAIKRLWNQ